MSHRGSAVATAFVVNATSAAALVGVVGWPSTAAKVGWAFAVVVGVAAGYGLFASLAGRARPTLAGRRVASVVATGSLLVLGAAVEEIVWRGLALGATAPEIGIVPAFVASTIGFALIHLEPRAIVTHLLTGACFGGVFVVTGSLTAAVAAHASYNLAILLARAPPRSPALAITSFPRRRAGALSMAIDARQVVKRYRAVEALRGFDLEVDAGEVVALLGPNGSGKTTAIHVLLGLRRADAGTVRVLGREPGDFETRGRLGVTLQEMGCPPTVRVGEVVSFAAAHYPGDSPVAELLESYGLAHLARRQIGGLSGGERRRLAIALAFAGRPRLVFLDEPTTGLDVESRRQAWAGIGAFSASGGTVLLTTHSLEEAEALASRVAVMRAGMVVRSGTAAALKRELGAATLEDAFVTLTGPEQ